MLAIVVWFVYSRATTCCEALKVHLGCPSVGNPFGACIGFETCGDLKYYGITLRELPEELPFFDPVADCNAFPRPTLLGRLSAVMCVVLILLPVNSVLQALFVMSNSTPVPSNWYPLPSPESKFSKRLLGPVGSLVVHVMLSLGYAIFVNFSYFNKVMVMIIVGTISSMLNINKLIITAFRRMLEVVRKVKRVGLLAGMALYSLIGANRMLESIDRQTAHMEYIAELSVMPSIDGAVEKFTYILLFGWWGMLLWSLLAFQAFLRSAIGHSAMDDILLEWVTTVVMEHFGLASLRLIAFKLVSIWIGVKLMNSINKDKGIEVWYEEHVGKTFHHLERLITASKREQEEDEEGDAVDVEEEDGNGEEAMGDDAHSGDTADINI
ncbi:hypothetical protein CYMTET_34114 [Cymbomonas tetramitiformis]|uniref:Uncharacterized protein n=1 Tax=Cymbomonas tetramitiformis TaxID=36881 RepID=A0AAE0FBW7_9CHLO|nr:hypothetical protein CYMTET_34114 [Cymbomonas tetramitiformis]